LEVEEDRRGERDPDQPGDEIEPAGVEQAAEDAGVEDVVADDEAACLRLTVDAARDVLLDVEIRSMDPGRHEGDGEQREDRGGNERLRPLLAPAEPDHESTASRRRAASWPR